MTKDSKKKVEDKGQTDILRKQAEEYLDGWKRCKADFENYKKQQQDWAAHFRLYAAQEVLEDIIPVVDNFELAVNHIPQTPANQPWLDGVSHIKKQLEDVLAGRNVTAIETQAGDAFDPNIHECVVEPGREECRTNNGTPQELLVKKVVRKGYKIGEKLLRPTQVTLENSPKS